MSRDDRMQYYLANRETINADGYARKAKITLSSGLASVARRMSLPVVLTGARMTSLPARARLLRRLPHAPASKSRRCFRFKATDFFFVEKLAASTMRNAAFTLAQKRASKKR
jgi:hypothetical protein